MRIYQLGLKHKGAGIDRIMYRIVWFDRSDIGFSSAATADYVGYAARYVEEAFDTPVNCLFIQGGAGNQAPLFKDGGRESADDPGSMGPCTIHSGLTASQ